MNTVGTYGVASAGYFWGRFSAASMIRLLHYLAGTRWSPEILLFADDWIALPTRAFEIVEIWPDDPGALRPPGPHEV